MLCLDGMQQGVRHGKGVNMTDKGMDRPRFGGGVVRLSFLEVIEGGPINSGLKGMCLGDSREGRQGMEDHQFVIPVGFRVVRSGCEEKRAIRLLARRECSEEISHFLAVILSEPGSQGAPRQAGEMAALGGWQMIGGQGIVQHFMGEGFGSCGFCAASHTRIQAQRFVNLALVGRCGGRSGLGFRH